MLSARIRVVLLFCLAAPLSMIKAEDKPLPTIFDEKFTDNPHGRFKMLPVTNEGSSSGNGKYDEVNHAYLLGGHLSLVRPVQAGPYVELKTTLRFEKPKADSPAVMETDLLLVLMDQTLAGIEVVRSTKPDEAAKVRFVQQRSGEVKPKILKEVPLTDKLDGTWLLRYRHGLLTLVQNAKTVASIDLSRLGISVAGVSWTQKGGEVTCQGMTLVGEPARKLEQTDQQSLQRAGQLNMEARKLLNNKKPEEALKTMEEASALYLKVHGDKHHDYGNSVTNLAYILEAMGKQEEAGKQWAKSLSIHEVSLGATHPHTTLTRFNLGKNYMNQGDKVKTKEHWTKCRDDWKAVLGSDYPLVKQLESILPNL